MNRRFLPLIHLLVGVALLSGLFAPAVDAFAQEGGQNPEATVEATVPATGDESAEQPEATATPADQTPSPSATTTAKVPKKKTPSPEPTVQATEAATELPTESPTEVATETTTELVETPTAAATKPAKTPEPEQPKLAAVSPAITISKTSGIVGTSVTVKATGFPASATLSLKWDGVQVGSARSDRAGAASFTLRVPAAIAGAHKIAVSTTGKTKSKTFTVLPRMTLSPVSGKAGTTVYVTLTGFGASESVTVKWGGATNVASGKTDSKGGWKGSFKVPQNAAAGTVTLRATGAGGSAAERSFSVTGVVASPTPTSTPVANPGTLDVRTKSSGGASISGACFKVYKNVSGARGALVGEACDSANGADGTTTIGNLVAGAVFVVQSVAPDGYLPAAPVAAAVVANEKRTVDVVNQVNSGITVVKTDEAGALLPGACFAIFTDIGSGKLGSQVKSSCDNAGAADGLTTFDLLDAGNYVLVETVIPRGYARAANKRFTVSAGKPVLLTIANQPGGSVLVTLVNEAGDGIKGACFDAYVDLGGSTAGNFVDRGCNDDGNKITISGLPVGNYFLVESKTPIGFKAADRIAFSIVAKQDTSVNVVNLPTTKLIVRKKTEAGAALKSSCFTVYKNSGGTRGAKIGEQVCDNADGSDDAYVRIALSPGSYLLAESKPPRGYLAGADIAFTIRTGLDTELDVKNVLGGTLKVYTWDTEYFWVPDDACYTVWAGGAQGPKSIKLGNACDAADGRKDGITIITGLPTGTWTLEQSTTPWGYFETNDIRVETVARETREVDVYNDPWPLLIIHKVDENGDPLADACFTGFTDLGGGQRGPEWRPPGGICGTDEDGIMMLLVTPGNQILVETRAPLGYLPVTDTRFTMVKGEVTELTIVNRKVGALTITKTDMEGKELTGACFEAWTNVAGKRGTLVASGCDRETNDGTHNPTLDAKTVLNGLTPGQYWLVEKTPPKGYFAAADRLVTVKSADNPVTVENERWPELTITKVDEEGKPVTGACFQLYTIRNDGRGAAYGGRVCGTATNIMKIGAAPGDYILAETVTPKGLVTMQDIRVTFERGKDTARTIVNKSAGFIEITNLKEGELPLDGSCWKLYMVVNSQRGAEVKKGCDSDTNEGKGITLIDAPPGTYWLAQDKTPDGYKPAADVKVTLVARQTTKVTIKNEPYPRLLINSVNAANDPLVGACFDLYVDDGDKLGKKLETKRCDDIDGFDDGSTTKRLPPGRYVAIEVTAPAGYAKTPQFKFTIETGKDLSIKLQHQIAGEIKIATKDRAAVVLKGACYELWTRTSAGAKGVLVDRACDKNPDDRTSALDGTVRLFALPPGVYILSESFAPTGYAKPADRTVTVVGGQTLELTSTHDKV